MALTAGTSPDSSASTTAFTPHTTGTWCFGASYAGDSNYSGSTDNTTGNGDANECVTVTKAGSGSVTTAHGSGVLGASGNISDGVVVTGNLTGGSPTGNVTFYTCGPAAASPSACSASSPNLLATQVVALTAGTSPDSSASTTAFTPHTTGTWCFGATYAGDTNYSGSTDNTTGNGDANECVTVTKAGSGSVTTAHGSGVLGASGNISDGVVVTGNLTGGSPTGNVTFYTCGPAAASPSACSASSSDLLATQVVALTAGTSPDSSAATTPFAPTNPGTWCFGATYAGDNNYTGSTDNTTGNGDANECVVVTAPNFSLLKTDVPGNNQPVVPGATVPYTVTIHNNGDGAGSAVISDTLPSNLTITGTPNCAVASGDACTVANPSGSTWTFSVTLVPGNTATVTFSAVVSATDTADVVNTAAITTGRCIGDNICTSTVTNPVPNFSVHKTNVPGDGNPVVPGATVPYTVTIQNTGDGAGIAVITDTLPSNLTITGTPTCAVAGGDACTVANPSGSTWTFSVGLAAGNTATVTFSAVVSATDTADVVNTATVTTGPCNADNACTSTVTNPVPDFTVTKTDVPGNNQTVAPGATIPYTVAIKNVGDGAGSATITDTLPSSLTIQGKPTCAVTGSDTCTVTNTTGSTWTFVVTLASGDTATVTFSAVLAASATGTVANTATITTGPCNTSSGCSSTVSNPIPPASAPAVITPTTVAPAPAPATAPAAIAFTGADIATMGAAALVLLGLGSFLVIISRRRRRAGEDG